MNYSFDYSKNKWRKSIFSPLIFYNISLLFSHHETINVSIIDIDIITINPNGLSCNGSPTFIPQKLDIIVGTASIIVIDVSVFITPFRLFEIIDAYASIVPLKMLL